jgi:hypothetical protein
VSVTSHDVARLAGVSQPTVSRALRDDPRVSQTTRRKVLEAARVLGYVPSELGRSLSTRVSRQIAMVADIDNALYPVLVRPIHDALAEQGYRMVVVAEQGDEASAYERLFDRSADAAILTTTAPVVLPAARAAPQGHPAGDAQPRERRPGGRLRDRPTTGRRPRRDPAAGLARAPRHRRPARPEVTAPGGSGSTGSATPSARPACRCAPSGCAGLVRPRCGPGRPRVDHAGVAPPDGAVLRR